MAGEAGRRIRTLLTLALLACLAGSCCLENNGKACRAAHAESDCSFQNGGKGAICIYDGMYAPMCAFPDRECASGYRWSELSYKVTCECVAPELLTVDAGTKTDS